MVRTTARFDSEGARGPRMRTEVVAMDTYLDRTKARERQEMNASRSTRFDLSTALVALLCSRGTPANISSSGWMSAESWYFELAGLSSICMDTNAHRKSRSDPCSPGRCSDVPQIQPAWQCLRSAAKWADLRPQERHVEAPDGRQRGRTTSPLHCNCTVTVTACVTVKVYCNELQ